MSDFDLFGVLGMVCKLYQEVVYHVYLSVLFGAAVHGVALPVSLSCLLIGVIWGPAHGVA